MTLINQLQQLSTNWKTVLGNSDLLSNISTQHSEQKKTYEPHLLIFPPDNLIFNAFKFFPIQSTKVVILGQDPYINPNEAMGLAFSVPEGTKMPPSLRNIFKELETEYGVLRTNTDLTDWAEQGVLLLNTALTVLQGKSNFNAKMWKGYTDYVIEKISEQTQNIVFILWGNNAIKKRELIDEGKHLVLTGVHPSPLSASRGFFGCNHFRKTNDWLEKKGKEPVNWI